MRKGWVFALLLLLGLSVPAAAAAHPDVDEGRERYRNAEFDAALEAFARAEQADDLTRDDLILLFESRALVHSAMQSAEDAEADLARLAVVAPDHELSRRVPPDLRETFDRLRQEGSSRPSVRVTAEAHEGGGAAVQATVEGDAVGLVRHVRVHGRSPASGSWLTAEDGPLEVPADPGTTVDHYAEAVGPGGVVLATAGSEEEPEEIAIPHPAVAAEEPTEGGDGVPWLWVGIGGGVAAAVGAIVLIAVLASDGGGFTDETQPMLPPLGEP